MRFQLRYISFICLFIFSVSSFYLLYTVFTPNAPIHVMTKLIYEPGHDIVNDELCHEGKPPRVLIGVISAPQNHAERNAIRATWGNIDGGDIVLAFLVGTSLDADENRLVTKESLRHTDIVRSKNVDSYMNLTLKSISLIEWAYSHCRNVRFVMKCDDDVFVNATNLLSFVNTNFNSKNTIFGELGKGLGPLWWPPRWYVSAAEYDKPKYPDFVFGPAYLLSSDCLWQLYEHALNTEFFRLEDVFITGIVAESALIKRVDSWLFTRRDYTPDIDNGINFNYLKEAKVRISIHGLTPSQNTEIWNFISKT